MADDEFGREKKRSIFSKLFCCSSSKLGRSVHFHAPADDSVHVMLKHDRNKNLEKGIPQKGYSARKPLSEIIKATEEDDQIVKNIACADSSNQENTK